jgi:poly(U)-specific endoribonuclease
VKLAAAEHAIREAARVAREEQERVVEEAKKAVPTPEELEDIAKACARLWDFDFNRLTPYKEYELDLQGGANPYKVGDAAERPLFKRVDESIFQRPTYARFLALLDNYISAVGVAEVVDDNEIYENKAFIQSCLETPVMLYTHKYLVAKGKASEDLDKFASELYVLWFQLYTRVVENDSSGFEHVFVGEVKAGEGGTMGMHNWIQLWNEEKNQRLDYKGYIKPKKQNAWHDDPNLHQLIPVQFSWNSNLKPASTSFFGTSPEFELAIYTLCFLAGQETNLCKLGPNACVITCYNNDGLLGSSFPEIP